MIDREHLIKKITDSLTEGRQAHHFADIQKSIEIAVDAVRFAYGNGEELNENFIEDAAASVHEAWLLQNKEGATEEEQRPYALLSEETKEKDRQFVRAAIEGFTHALD